MTGSTSRIRRRVAAIVLLVGVAVVAARLSYDRSPLKCRAIVIAWNEACAPGKLQPADGFDLDRIASAAHRERKDIEIGVRASCSVFFGKRPDLWAAHPTYDVSLAHCGASWRVCARERGEDEDNIFVCENGRIVRMWEFEAFQAGNEKVRKLRCPACDWP